MAFLSAVELQGMGFGALGENVLISQKASIYNPANIYLGSNIRVDDFCILSAGAGGIFIENNVHLACYVGLIGAGKIMLSAFCGISARSMIYSSNDDYTGDFLTGPTIPAIFRKVTTAPVTVGRHVIVGAGTIILPGAILNDGAAVGSMSLVKGILESDAIYIGVPAKKIKDRNIRYKMLEQEYLNGVNA